jgi:hypothetical protein
MELEEHGERGAPSTRREGPGVAVGQEAGLGWKERCTVLGHGARRRAILLQIATPSSRTSVARLTGAMSGSRASRAARSPEHAVDRPGQVDRGGARSDEQAARILEPLESHGGAPVTLRFDGERERGRDAMAGAPRTASREIASAMARASRISIVSSRSGRRV